MTEPQVASHAPNTLDRRPLPPGWRWVHLGELCEDRILVRDPQEQPEQEFFYVDISSVNTSVKRIVAPKRLLGRDAPSRARQVIRTNDVLVATTRPNLNAVALVPPELDGQVASTGFCVLRPADVLDARYLFQFVQTAEFVHSLSDLVKAALYPAVADQQVRDQWIPAPELPEQRSIAAKLDGQMAGIERARAATEEGLEAARALTRAYLSNVFDGPIAGSWPKRRLMDLLIQPVKTGISKPFAPAADKRCLTLSAVRDGVLDLAASKPVAVSDAEAEGNWVKPRAFYVVRGNGQIRLVGRGALAPTGYSQPVLYPDLLFEIMTDPDHIDPEYLSLVWQSEAVRTDVEQRARTSAGIFKINRKNLVEVTLPVPAALEVQRQTVVALTKQIQRVRQVQATIDAALADIASVSKALLRRTFSGDS